jgi:transcriptional regulator with XRE-family HTH domain
VQESLAKKLRVLRADKGITLDEAEKLTGVTRETIGALEHAQRGAHTRTLEKIARGYDVPVEYLVSPGPALPRTWAQEPALAEKDEAPETGPEVEPENHPSSPGHWVAVLARFPYENPEEWPYAFRKAASVMEEAHLHYDRLSLRDNGERISVVVEMVGLPEGAGEGWLTPEEAIEIIMGMGHDRSRTPSS